MSEPTLRICCSNPKVLCRKCHDRAIREGKSVAPWSDAADRRLGITATPPNPYALPTTPRAQWPEARA